jgi:hypothetical protein
MSISDQVADLAKKATALYEETITMKVRFEALDKEVHRMLDSMQRLMDKHDQKQSDMERRLVLLEAQFKTVYQSAIVESVRGSLRVVVQETVAEEMNRRSDHGLIQALPPRQEVVSK